MMSNRASRLGEQVLHTLAGHELGRLIGGGAGVDGVQVRHRRGGGQLVDAGGADEEARQTYAVVGAEHLVHTRAAQVGVDDHDAAAHLGEGDAEPDGGGGLALAGHRRRDEDAARRGPVRVHLQHGAQAAHGLRHAGARVEVGEEVGLGGLDALGQPRDESEERHLEVRPRRRAAS
jgi:hypothetical protein